MRIPLCLALLLSLFATSGSALFEPPSGKTLLILGQDLQSVHNYVNTTGMPTPGGITTYIDLHSVDDGSAYFPFGGLGETVNGLPAPDIDWGAGPLNARNASLGYPNSTLAIGLSMTETWHPGALTRIAGGQYDARIRRLGRFIADRGKPTFVRIGYEFDGNWNTGYDNRTLFIAAWRRIADTIRAYAGGNAALVWQASTSPIDDIIEGRQENILDWWPGDDLVDWLGLSWFLSGHPEQQRLANEVLALARLKNKPVMIAEASPQGFDLQRMQRSHITSILDGPSGTGTVSVSAETVWSSWFAPFFAYIHNNSDAIRAVAYINANWNSQAKWAPPYAEGYWGDSRVEANPEIRSRWLAEITNPRWLHGSPTLFATLRNNANISSSIISSSQIASSSSRVSSSSLPPSSSSTTTVISNTFHVPGKTHLLIGQTWQAEFQAQIQGTGRVPAGSSHYGQLYTGRIDQGDDAQNTAFLNWVSNRYPGSFAQVAISIKDNPAAGGYSGHNATWKALKDIVAGRWDAQLDAFAATLARYPQTRFFVRIDYETSLMGFANKLDTPFVSILDKYNRLGFNALENAHQIPEFDLQAYPEAFRYIARRLRNHHGLSNVEFVYHPVRGFSDTKWLYPGSEWVDWVAFSLFNHDLCWPTWEGANPPFENCPSTQLLDANLERGLNWARDSVRKPILIAESAVQSHTGRQSSSAHKIGWLQKIHEVIQRWDIGAWVYIDSYWDSHGWGSVWGDSRMWTDPIVLREWQRITGQPRYLHGFEPTVKTQYQPLKTSHPRPIKFYQFDLLGRFNTP